MDTTKNKLCFGTPCYVQGSTLLEYTMQNEDGTTTKQKSPGYAGYGMRPLSVKRGDGYFEYLGVLVWGLN